MQVDFYSGGVEHAILHPIKPAAAIRPLIRREAERVRDATRRISIVRQFPKLFHTKAVNLRFATFIQAEPANQLLGE